MSQMSLRKVKGNFDRLFDKSLQDLIRGIRNNKENEAKYIAQCMEEIKQELKQDNVGIKKIAVEKLSYLQMCGYDISWAAFNVIEVMASSKFTEKRIGYLAAAQSFHENTDVLMLTTNMIRKDLNSTNIYDAGTALGGLSCFITVDLARDLANDIVTLLTSSRPYIRKRAVLLLYKVFLRYPDALRPTFPRLKEKLEDPDPGVQSATVNVICELARKNPKNYLSLAPLFFKLMTSSSNNWMLIKIIKLFGALVPLEPRLGKKLLEPLTNLINSTSAMSLLYECINTVIAVLISVSSGAPGDHSASIQLCVSKLGILIEDTDQNLKYLGLLAMGKILQTHPKAVQAHKDIVLSCLDDKDESIRLRALDLIYGMVSKKNIMEIVKKLMEHVEAAEGSNYRDELLARIIDICAHNNYQYITNFEWYVSVLVELTKVEGTKHGTLIAQQMLDVAVRVQSIRHFGVSQMALLIENAQLLLAGSAQQRSNISEVLLAASWICGEYSEHLRNPQSCLESMLRTKVSLMPGHIQSSFVQNIGKLYSVQLEEAEKEEDWDRVYSLDNLMLSKLPQFEQTDHLEAQERACSLIELMKDVDALHKQQEKLSADIAILFEGELNPIAPKAQRKVPVPEGLDLEAWINQPPESSSESEEEEDIPRSQLKRGSFGLRNVYQQEERQEVKKPEPTEKELRKMREARQAEYESNPHYLKGSPPPAGKKRPQAMKLSKKKSDNAGSQNEMSESVSLDLQSPLEIPGMVGLDRYLEQQQSTMSWKKAKKEKKKKKGKRKKGVQSSSEEENIPVVHQVNRGQGEMPDDAKSTDDESDMKKFHNGAQNPYAALDINLDEPLREDERLPVLSHRVVSPTHPEEEKTDERREDVMILGKGKKKKKKEEREKEEKKKKKSKVREEQTEVKRKEEVRKEKDTDDLDFWLSGKVEDSKEENGREEEKETGKKKKPKKGEKHAKKKLSKKDSKRGATLENNGGNMHLNVGRDRSDYEVASGVCTPSKKDSSTSSTPQRPTASPAPQLMSPETSSYQLLAENRHLKLTFETRVSTSDANQIVVSMIFANLWAKPLKNLELNVLDSLNAKLLREPTAATSGGGYADQAGVRIPFSLPPGISNESQFRFSVQSINQPQKLRGTLTYMVEAENGAVPDKLDFHLRFPCVAFTVPATLGRDAFTEVLRGGDLTAKESIKFPCAESLEKILSKICFWAHFSVVEQMDSSASLYSQTIQAQPVCLLVKIQSEQVSLDGKSSEMSLLSNIIREIKDIIINK